MRIVGGLVLMLGAFLWLGNVIGFFPTVPFLGYLTMLGGGAMMRSASA
jgi:UPF0716 family protein affecting phage T7 exclusion